MKFLTAQRVALIAAGSIALILILAAAISAADLPLFGLDFITFWTGGQAMRQGYSPYDMAFQAATQQANGWDAVRQPIPFQPYSYPPWLAIFMWPLSGVPYRVAFNLWLALSFVALALAAYTLLKIVHPSARPIHALAAMLLSFTFVPVLHGFAVGQLSAALFVVVAGMIWSLKARRDRLAGVLMGVLSVKPHIGVILVAIVSIGLIARRRFRPFVWAAATLVVCAGASFLISPSWPGDMLASFDRFTALSGFTFPLNGFQDDPTAYGVMRVSLESNPIVSGLLAAGLAGLAFVLLRNRRERAGVSLQWLSAAACIAVFIFAPYARAYDMTLLLWPMLYIAFSDELAVAPAVRLVVCAGVYALPLLLALLGAQGVGNFSAAYVLALALLAAKTSSVQAPR